MKLLRQLFESLRFAWQALTENILRTTLSLLGVSIGIFSIIAVLTLVDSMNRSITTELESFGKGVVYVGKWPWIFSNNYPWWKYLNRPNTRFSEYQYLKEKVDSRQAIAIMDRKGGLTFKNGSNSLNATLTGCSFEYDKIQEMNVVKGRYFIEKETESGASSIIIGSTIAETLFGDIDPIDKEIKVNGVKFRVIGVLIKKGKDLLSSLGDDDPDAQAYISYRTFANIFQKDDPQPDIALKALTSDVGEFVLEGEIEGLMRNIRGLKPLDEDNFSINRLDGATKFFEGVFGVLTLAGWVIGLFSMLVGGFGIANIMFVSVKERTSQIGIQKSLGAKNYFVLLQFLFEAVFLAVLGGIVGLFIVFVMSVSVSNLSSFQMSLSLQNVILGLSVSGLIGLVSGFVPAWSASRLDPVEAMRSNF